MMMPASITNLSSTNLLIQVNQFSFPIFFFFFQTEIAKRLNALINQLLPCLQVEHQQQVMQAVDRAKQVTMPELNAIIGVSIIYNYT